MYSVSGSSWNSSFTTIHMSALCRRIMSSNIACRFVSHPSRTAICCDHGSNFGIFSFSVCAGIGELNSAQMPQTPNHLRSFISIPPRRILTQFLYHHVRDCESLQEENRAENASVFGAVLSTSNFSLLLRPDQIKRFLPWLKESVPVVGQIRVVLLHHVDFLPAPLWYRRLRVQLYG